jgi:DHA1 family tetracycline resistance protein-like MFS transporter
MGKKPKSPLFIIFTTVLIDLIGFGMVIPLIGLYGKHYGAAGFQLALLGGIYSGMQFFFAPIWGAISDRIGRRPVLLISLAGSTLSYLIFGLAPSYTWLLMARAFGGIFAANISTAQAYIADVTTPADRAKGMGLIGAAFGIGFTLGPPLGGIASAHIGLAAPGLIAASICGANFLLAVFRLPETLPPAKRQRQNRSLLPLTFNQISHAIRHQTLGIYLLTFFLYVFGFSMMEQTFSLLFQNKFQLDTGLAGYKTGLVLMFSGIWGALVQGVFIRRLVIRFGEHKLLLAGLVINTLSLGLFPFIPTYPLYFLLGLPLALGSGLINPTLSSLISKSANDKEQGATLGMSQGLGSLARALGPFSGLMTFAIQPEFPYLAAAFISFLLALFHYKFFYFKSSNRRALNLATRGEY